MTVAEHRFFEAVPIELRTISNQLMFINQTLDEIKETLTNKNTDEQ